MFSSYELRQALISYQDHHMFSSYELRQALISYQDYHMCVAHDRRRRRKAEKLFRGSEYVVPELPHVLMCCKPRAPQIVPVSPSPFI